MNDFDVIILGGGAAGLFCAFTAGNRGRRVLVLEGSNRIGKKILMSGGGRCNFTNLHCEPSRFLSANPHFCISSLSRYTQRDFIALVEKHGIAYHEKTAGQLFCDRSSRDIVAMLKSECDAAGVQIVTHCQTTSVRAGDCYEVHTDKGHFTCSALVVATGGLSIPKMGGSDFGYRLARQFGLPVRDTRAGLVPFTFSGRLQDLSDRLAGVSAAVSLSTAGMTFTDDILFTHRGLSGPAALQLSSYWQPGATISADLLPGRDARRMLAEARQLQPKALLRTVLSTSLPRALVIEAEQRLWPSQASKPLAEWSNVALQRAVAGLNDWQLKPSGTEGYRTAEVTLGGIDTNAFSSQTMECRHHPGLYCIGEVMDVTGHLGGFNFQWAWSSAYAAGQAV